MLRAENCSQRRLPDIPFGQGCGCTNLEGNVCQGQMILDSQKEWEAGGRASELCFWWSADEETSAAVGGTRTKALKWGTGNVGVGKRRKNSMDLALAGS